MTAWTRFWLVLCGAAASVTALYAFQREFRVYTSLEGYDNIALPEDYRIPGEFVFGRLMYPPHPRGRFSRPIVLRPPSATIRRESSPGCANSPARTSSFMAA